MNSGGIARDPGGNTRDSGVNGLNDFFREQKDKFDGLTPGCRRPPFFGRAVTAAILIRKWLSISE